MNKIFITALILLTGKFVFAQPNFFWAKSVGGVTATNQPNSVGYDASGNVYTVGSFTGTMDFDPGASTYTMNAGNGAAYITKFDPFGNFVWAKPLGGSCTTGNALAVDASGNIHITGSYCGTLDFDPGPGTFTLSSMNTDCFICKLNSGGNFVWAVHFPSSGSEYGYGITVDGSGNVYSTGIFFNPTDFDPGPGSYSLTSSGGIDAFVSKLNSSGNFVWAAGLGGTGNDYGYGISVDGSGNVLTTGTFSATADFDPAAGTYTMVPAGSNDVYVSKLDVNGAFVWARQLGGTLNDSGTSINTDPSGNVLTTGSFNGIGDFDPGAGTFNMTSAGSNDVFISKLSAAGVFVWAKQIGGNGPDGGNGVTSDASGNVYTTGYYNNTVDFDPGPGTYSFTSAGLSDLFISKLDPSGNFSWAVQMGGTGGDNSNSIAVDANLFVYTTGNFQNTVDFNPGAGINNLSSVGSSDIFVHKLASCTLTPSQPSSISGLTITCANPGPLTYSIAPVGGVIGYLWTLPAGWSGSSSTNTLSASPGVSGIFMVVASNSCGISPAQTLSVTVNALPSITITPYIGTVCIGGTVTLAGNGAGSYTWNPGPASTTISVSPSVTTSYSVTGINPAGCTNTAVRIVTVYPNPTVTAVTNTSLLCIGQSAILTASGATNYNWNPAGTGATIIVTPTVNTTYTLIGSTLAGCTNTTTITQSVTSCVGLNELSLGIMEFGVYPNPNSGVFNVKFSTRIDGLINIYNASGMLMASFQLNGHQKEIDLSKEPAGLYFVQVSSSNGVVNRKIFKE